MTWILIGVAVVAWLIGLLLAIGPVVHLFLVAAGGLLVFEVWRTRRAPGS
jgi:hypothetical protein